MNRVQSMFGRPFSSPAGQIIEIATTSNDNSLFGEAAAVISSYGEGPKDAIRALRKRLYANKNLTQVAISVSLLEYLVKHLTIQFHVLVANRDFAGEVLLRLLNPKTQPLPVVEKKVLGIIKLLAESYPYHPMLSDITAIYQELISKGHEFPRVKSFKTRQPSASPPAASTSSSRIIPPTQAVYLKEEQVRKLHSDIDIVDGNIRVFSEMLTDIKPDGDSYDLQLMSELNRTCHAMQQRIVELIGQVLNEEITVFLLRVNDDLNNVFLRYERFERYKKATVMDPPPSYTEQQVTNDLIDLGFDPAPSTSHHSPQARDNKLDFIPSSALQTSTQIPFQPLAALQATQMSPQPMTPLPTASTSITPAVPERQSLSSASDNLLSESFNTMTLNSMTADEAEVKEIEQWLTSDQQFGQQQGDFNVFLSQRASQSSSNKPTLL